MCFDILSVGSAWHPDGQVFRWVEYDPPYFLRDTPRAANPTPQATSPTSHDPRPATHDARITTQVSRRKTHDSSPSSHSAPVTRSTNSTTVAVIDSIRAWASAFARAMFFSSERTNK